MEVDAPGAGVYQVTAAVCGVGAARVMVGAAYGAAPIAADAMAAALYGVGGDDIIAVADAHDLPDASGDALVGALIRA